MRLILTFLTLVLAVMLSLPPGLAAKARTEGKPQASDVSSPKSGKNINVTPKITRKKSKG